MLIKSCCAMALLTVVLAFGACGGGGGTGTGGTTGSGGSTGSGGTGGGSSLPVIVSCKAFCVAEDNCNPNSDVADCYDYRCNNPAQLMPFDTQPASCQTAYKAWYDCLAHQTSVCDPVEPAANIPGNCVAQTDALANGNCAAK